MASPDLQQALFDIYLEEILIPALVELPEVDLKKTSLRVREGAARYLRHRRGASIKTIARHLGVSHRWVSMVTNGPGPDEPEEGWFMAIMDVMTDAFPDPVSARRVQSRLRRRNRQLSFQAVQAHLDLYCDIGKLERVGEGYRAFAPVKVRHDASGKPYTERVRKGVLAFRPLCESYAQGKPGSLFGVVNGEMDATLLDEMSAELKSAFNEIVGRYVERSLSLESSEKAQLVHFDGLLLLGETRARGARGGSSCSDPILRRTREATPSSSGFLDSSASPEGKSED